MAWRGIHLSRPAYLSLENRALKLDFKDEGGGMFRCALEDLSYLILDTTEISLSARILSALSEASVLVLGCDGRHLPCWTSLPWTRFHKQGDTLSLQLGASVPQKKQLWSHIVRAKLLAQAHCLFINGRAGGDHLEALAKQVRSGDPENIEARAARHYWRCLFPDREFRRHDDDLPNALLNYGYALIRAALARQLCGRGYVTQIGLHHDSATNAYNLADDLIEPFRPTVDHFALECLADSPSNDEFVTDHRRGMARLLEAELDIDGEVFSTMNAIEETTASLRRALSSKEPSMLRFPSFNPP